MALRVFIDAASADDRMRLRLEAERAGWLVVSSQPAADVVLSLARPQRHQDDLKDDEFERPHEALTLREHDVLELLAQGLGNREIAERLGISDHTVKFHLSAIFGKLGASTRTDAVRRALSLGLIGL